MVFSVVVETDVFICNRKYHENTFALPIHEMPLSAIYRILEEFDILMLYFKRRFCFQRTQTTTGHYKPALWLLLSDLL